MSHNSLNPYNSSIIQILLDLRTIANIDNEAEILELCNTLLSKLDNRVTLQKQVDDKFKSHYYNEKDITFSKVENFKKLKFVNKLSANSVKMLFLIIQTVSQDNLIELRISTLVDILKISKPTAVKCLSELVECGAVSAIQNNNRTQGTIYMLNPTIAFSGKYKQSDIFKKITQESSLSTFEELNKNSYRIITSKGVVPINKDENKYLSFNSLNKLDSKTS